MKLRDTDAARVPLNQIAQAQQIAHVWKSR
jgi:hypothetical protein